MKDILIKKIKYFKDIMLKNHLILISFFVFAYAFLPLAKGLPAGAMAEDWTRQYSFNPTVSEVPTDVTVDKDNNIIVVGFDKASQYDDQWKIIKLNQDGTKLWEKVINYASTTDEPESVDTDGNGNIIVAGWDMNTSEYLYKRAKWRVIKINPAGTNIIWNYTHDFPNASLPENYNDRAFDVAVNKTDNTFVVVGYDSELGSSKTKWRIIKFSASNTQLWNRSLDPNPNQNDMANGVALLRGNQIIIAGSNTTIGSTKPDWHILKLDQSGNIMSGCNFGVTLTPNDYDEPFDVAVDSSGNIYVVGYQGGSVDSRWLIIKYNYNCVEQRRWTNDWSTADERANGVTVDRQNNIIVVGYEKEGGDEKWRIIKFDSNLNVIWQTPVNPLVGNSNEGPHAVAVLQQRNITVVGSDDSPVADTGRQWRVVKFRMLENCSNDVDDDLDGKIDCLDSECPVDITCTECKEPVCNYYGNDYDWTCQNSAVGTSCGLARTCPGAACGSYQCQCNGFIKETYPPNGHDTCNGNGLCVPYSCAIISSYCTDNNQGDGVDAFPCGAPCDQNTDCTQTTSTCNAARQYCTRDSYGTCDSVCSCQTDAWTCGSDSDTNYCSNCNHCPTGGDGKCNCGETASSCTADCGGCTSNADCNDANECTTDVCIDPEQPTSHCENNPVADGSTCTGTPGRCCSGVCDTDGTFGSGYHTDCRTGPSCIGSGNWGYTTANQGLGCGSLIDYCYDQPTCDSHSHKYSCNTGYCNGAWANDQDSTANACNALACGSFVDYCYDQPTCDSHKHQRTCNAEVSCNGAWTNDQDSTANLCNGLACGSFIPYCSNPLTCDSRERQRICNAEVTCNGAWTNDRDATGNTCQGSDCGTCCSCGSTDNRATDDTQDNDCDGNDIPGIGTCLNNPDNFAKTWDFRSAFDSQCLALDSCSSGDPTITHTCADDNLGDTVPVGGCAAQCDENTDCSGIAAGCQDADCSCGNNCECKRCNFCYPGGTPGHDMGVICELSQGDNIGFNASTIEYYYANCMVTMERSCISHYTITDTRGGVYQLCGYEGQQPHDCPTDSTCVDEGVELLMTHDQPFDEYIVVAKHISGEPGFKITLGCEPQYPVSSCVGDTDVPNDGVGMNDVVLVITNYENPSAPPNANVDGQNGVNMNDVVLVITNYGPCT